MKRLRIFLLIAASALQSPTVLAQTPEKTERELELRRTEENLQRNEAERLRLQREIETLRGDRARFNAELLDTSRRVRTTEETVTATEARFAEQTASEAALRRSLEGRRDLIVEVMAALQRLGRRPPPAVIVRAEDMLEAVRASIMLGAVLPELRREAETLANDLAELVRLRDQILVERETLRQERELLLRERQRLEELVSARQASLTTAERSLADERQRAATLARQAQSLKELITRMEGENAAAKRAAEEAAKVPPASQSTAEAAQIASNAFRDPARLSPRVAFSDVKGMLNLPASGVISRFFGGPDPIGGTERGVTIATASGAVVTAPADGWVAFAGPFRSYRNVLILNTGGGYHIVLIGMEKVSVDVGQFVLTGEPVATMPVSAGGAATAPDIAGRPSLYVEFRKDGAPIDPGPWWAKSDNEKARG